MAHTVVVDFRLKDADNPGIQSFGLMLREVFSQISSQDLQFVWLVSDDHSWFTAGLSENQHWVVCEVQHVSSLTEIERESRRFVRFKSNESDIHVKLDERLPHEPAILKELEPSLIIFCSQDAFLTESPSIYHPHDLQHEFYSEFFTLDTIGWRNIAWRNYARRAKRIVVAANFIAQHIETFWNIDKNQINVIPTIPVGKSFEIEQFATQSIFEDFPELQKRRFVLYPAFYYRHKNHRLLFEAFAILLEKEIEVNLVLTGGLPGSAQFMEDEIKKWGVADYVKQLGYVERSKLRALFSAADFMVFPSLFEARAFPIDEAIKSESLFLASRIEGIVNQVEVPELLFDPFNALELATKMEWLLGLDIRTRSRLKDRIQTANSQLSLSEVAAMYLNLIYQVIEPS